MDLDGNVSVGKGFRNRPARLTLSFNGSELRIAGHTKFENAWKTGYRDGSSVCFKMTFSDEELIGLVEMSLAELKRRNRLR